MKKCKFCASCYARRNLATIVFGGALLFPTGNKREIKRFKQDYCNDPVNSKRCPVYGYVPTEQ